MIKGKEGGGKKKKKERKEKEKINYLVIRIRFQYMHQAINAIAITQYSLVVSCKRNFTIIIVKKRKEVNNKAKRINLITNLKILIMFETTSICSLNPDKVAHKFGIASSNITVNTKKKKKKIKVLYHSYVVSFLSTNSNYAIWQLPAYYIKNK